MPHSGSATLVRPLSAVVKVTAVTSQQLAEATGLFLDAVNAGRLRHVPDPRLDAAVRTAATRRLTAIPLSQPQVSRPSTA